MNKTRPSRDARSTPSKPLGESPIVSLGGLNMDMLRRQAEIEGDILHLPPREFPVLYLLLCGGGSYVTRAALAEAIETQESPIALPSVVSRLRKRLEPYGYRIATARGEGYRLEKAVCLDTT